MWDDVTVSIRKFFNDRGFVEFQTPLMVASPGMEPNLDPFELKFRNPVSNKKFSKPGFEIFGLITSPEYSMKKLLGAGFEKIYTITPVFRNNELIGSYNIPQFTMLEWYGVGDYKDCMSDTEDLVNLVMGWEVDWPRIQYQDAKVDSAGDPAVIKDYDRFFLTDYPAEQASLAKLSVDGKVAERFEAYVNGVELCNGFSELTDPVEQRARFEHEQEARRKLGKHVFPIDIELLESLGKIEKPVYGNALGVDRLVMLKYGVEDIHDIQLLT